MNLHTLRCRGITPRSIKRLPGAENSWRIYCCTEAPAPGQQDFEIKKPFTQNGQVEHIWLSDVQFVGNRLQGRVDNEARKIQGLKLGQLVSVKPSEISDWLYIDHGKLVGGYTVRVQYNELSPKEKQEFDRAADFKIGK